MHGGKHFRACCTSKTSHLTHTALPGSERATRVPPPCKHLHSPSGRGCFLLKHCRASRYTMLFNSTAASHPSPLLMLHLILPIKASLEIFLLLPLLLDTRSYCVLFCSHRMVFTSKQTALPTHTLLSPSLSLFLPQTFWWQMEKVS